MKKIIFCIIVLLPVMLLSDLSYLENDGNTWDKKNNLVRLIDGKYGSTSYLVEEKQRKAMTRYSDTGNSKMAEAVIRKYSPHKMFDGKKYTCWVEGVKGPGIGEGVVYAVEEIPGVILILPGFATKKWFKKNNRPKKILLQIFQGKPDFNRSGFGGIKYSLGQLYSKTVILKDKMKYQKIDLPAELLHKSFVKGQKNGFKYKLCIGITILSVYKGSLYNDTCIAEMKVY